MFRKLIATSPVWFTLPVRLALATAIFGVHWRGGLFAGNRGYEYPLSLLAMAVTLLISGAGQASVDKALSGGRRS